MCHVCEAQAAVPRPSRRRLFRILGAATAGFAMAGGGLADDLKAPPKPENVVSPSEALDRLTAGNARYVEGVARRHDFKHEREALTVGQNPYAAILGCADSRVSPEYAFDSARGDLFVCRVAGNFANDDMVASLEYAVASLGAPLIMVLGHDACGAVAATLKSVKNRTTLPGHLPSLANAITPAVEATSGMAGDPLANAIRENVVLTVARLKTATPILSAAVERSSVRIVGAIYRLADGRVELMA